MGILIDQAPDNTWRMVVREQFFLPDAGTGKELINYLMEKGIVFGVTYSDRVVIHLHDVEYIDEDYEGFLKVVGELLVYKKKYGIKPRIQSEDAVRQQMLQQQEIQQQVIEQEAVRQQIAKQQLQQQAEEVNTINQQVRRNEVDEELQHNV